MAARPAVERALGLMCGAGTLPAQMASVARRRGWRVIAFTFGEAPGVDAFAERLIPSRLTELGAVFARLREDAVGAALFAGRFPMTDVLRARVDEADAVSRGVGERAGSLGDARLAAAVIAALGAAGVEVLDQRPFVGDWLGPAGCWSARAPSEAEWRDVGRGLGLARAMADAGVGQTVVLRRGAVTAVEAVEGTTEAIRRGAALGGPGTIVVKAVARDHDYRFDTPAIGPETIAAAAAGGVSVVAIEAGRVAVLDRDVVIRAANAAAIALVSVDDDAR